MNVESRVYGGDYESINQQHIFAIASYIQNIVINLSFDAVVRYPARYQNVSIR